MVNWEDLDREFYNVLNNMTDQQWHSWRSQQESNRALRQKQKELEMELHLLSLESKLVRDEIILEQTYDSMCLSGIDNYRFDGFFDKKNTVNTAYALAA
jgi:hypothetical protein